MPGLADDALGSSSDGYRFRRDPELPAVRQGSSDRLRGAEQYRFRPLGPGERERPRNDLHWRPRGRQWEGERPADLFDSMSRDVPRRDERAQDWDPRRWDTESPRLDR